MIFRDATRDDLAAVVTMLADDVLGRDRDRTEVDAAYEKAFADIEADPRNRLIVAEDGGGAVIGCMQLTYIPGLGHHGAERCLVEGVRVRSDTRGGGVGGEMMRWAVAEARARGCGVVQLTTNKVRADAHRFYRRLGFVASHEGMKLPL